MGTFVTAPAGSSVSGTVTLDANPFDIELPFANDIEAAYNDVLGWAGAKFTRWTMETVQQTLDESGVPSGGFFKAAGLVPEPTHFDSAVVRELAKRVGYEPHQPVVEAKASETLASEPVDPAAGPHKCRDMDGEINEEVARDKGTMNGVLTAIMSTPLTIGIFGIRKKELPFDASQLLKKWHVAAPVVKGLATAAAVGVAVSETHVRANKALGIVNPDCKTPETVVRHHEKATEKEHANARMVGATMSGLGSVLVVRAATQWLEMSKPKPAEVDVWSRPRREASGFNPVVTAACAALGGVAGAASAVWLDTKNAGRLTIDPQHVKQSAAVAVGIAVASDIAVHGMLKSMDDM